MALPSYLAESLSLRGKVNGNPCFVCDSWK